MGLPIDKLNELMEEIKNLDDNDAQQVVVLIEDYIKSKKEKIRSKPSDYIGSLKHLNLNIEEECNNLSAEWDRKWD